MKIVFGVIFLVLGSFIGKKATDKYLQAKKYFAAFANFNRNLISNLEYKRESVKTLATINYCFTDFEKTVKSAFCENEEIFIPKYLDEIQVKTVKDYLDEVGRNNENAERAFLTYYDGEIVKILNECTDKNKKYGSLGLKLGFAAGAAAFILII